MKKGYAKAALFLASQAVTLLGSSIVQFAIIWYVTLETSSGGWVALLSAAAYIPQFLISFFAGVWADRYPRKLLIIAADGAIAVATLAFVLLLPQISQNETIYVALVVISAIRSLGTGVHTPAVNATVPQFVAEEHLMKFNGINATIQSVVQFAAPAIAGSILTWGSFRGALMVDVVTAMVGIGLLSAIVIPFEERTETAPVSVEMQEGIRYAAKERFLGKLIMLFGLFIFLCVPAGFLATLFVSRYYGDTYFHMTLVEVIGFLGMMAGGLQISTWGGFKRHTKTLLVGMVSFGLLAILMGLANNFYVYLVLMAVYGVALTMVQTASTTLLQENSTQEMSGRVFGLFGAAYSSFLPIGMVVFGLLADRISMRLLMVVSGGLLILMAAVMLFDKSFYQHGFTSTAMVSNSSETK